MIPAGLTDRGGQLAAEVFSLRGAVFVFGKLCLVAAVGFAYETGLALHDAQDQEFPLISLASPAPSPEQDQQTALSQYAVIGQRNIFGAEEAAPTTPTATISAPSPELKVRLVGTNISPENSFAIIEDTKTKDQDLFEVNDQVFGQATLVRIDPVSVSVRFNGQIQRLILEEGTGSAAPASGIEPNAEGTEFVVAENEVEEALANLPRLLSQARAVPYFRNGEAVGMRLFAIRRGSLYEKLGLKNGDILTEINSNSLSDPTQALRIFEKLKTERSIQVALERRGQPMTLRYEIR
ncbi:MAG: hypothetical protein KDD44_00710 [Bdellovibrionales bacterium]|nr:hypothetical protein [Bdellovibrionales bacterium]